MVTRRREFGGFWRPGPTGSDLAEMAAGEVEAPRGGLQWPWAAETCSRHKSSVTVTATVAVTCGGARSPGHTTDLPRAALGLGRGAVAAGRYLCRQRGSLSRPAQPAAAHVSREDEPWVRAAPGQGRASRTGAPPAGRECTRRFVRWRGTAGSSCTEAQRRVVGYDFSEVLGRNDTLQAWHVDAIVRGCRIHLHMLSCRLCGLRTR